MVYILYKYNLYLVDQISDQTLSKIMCVPVKPYIGSSETGSHAVFRFGSN
jgi:hypothetical protein